MKRVGFQNFLDDEACLEEGNCFVLLFLLLESFLVSEVKDWVLDMYGCVCLGLDDLFGCLGLLNGLVAE